VTQPPMHAGLEGDDLARAKAADANALGIVEGRRRMARMLLAPPGPKRALAARFSAILHPDKARPPSEFGDPDHG
jgi:hypothetical protein